ncbi:MAG: glycosyltransferase [Bacteroidota bacterium]
MSSHPLVTVICLCYNHAKFVRQAIESVLDQDYPAIELIVVDDASTDNSVDIIEEMIEKKTAFTFLKNQTNQGNCASFNRAFTHSKGEFIIDLAADDVLLPDRISCGVVDLESKGDQYGVQYGAVELIDESSKFIGHFYDSNPNKPISGDLYEQLIEKFFVSGPSMFMRRVVLEDMEGYDEQLDFEDFDLCIRSSRNFLYSFTEKTVVKKRIHSQNYSKKQKQFRNKLGRTTLQVCEKIFGLNESLAEHRALQRRIKYEMKKSIQFGNIGLCSSYYRLLKSVNRKVKAFAQAPTKP